MNEPLNFPEAMIATTQELRRLGWTTEQGRNHLSANYGKRSRQLLSDEELCDFLNYLQTQPTPSSSDSKPSAASIGEIDVNLGERRDCLNTDNTRSRQQLSDEERREFSSYLQAQPTPPANGPLNFSEAIIATTQEIQRLGWTTEQGRNHLSANYGKRSRQLLSDDELCDFLNYLQTQPTPSSSDFEPSAAIFPKIESELQRLGWTVEREGSYLMQNYGTRSRQALTATELQQFLSALQALLK